MEKKYIAHINEELKTEQTVKEHKECIFNCNKRFK